MIVLGIHDGHNASAALLVDGQMVAACEEERFTGVKNQTGYPQHAIASVLDIAAVPASAINLVAVAGQSAAPGFVPPAAHSREAVLQRHEMLLQHPRSSWREQLYRARGIRAQRRRFQRRARAAAFSQAFPQSCVQLIDHHECHASAAYYSWGRLSEPVLVLTADGDGDDLSGSVSRGENGLLRRLAAIDRSDSLGWPYEAVTYLLGMQPLEHEYKVMGLAPYAAAAPQVQELAEQFKTLFRMDGEATQQGLGWRRREGLPPMNRITYLLQDMMRRRRFDYVAGAIQEFTEWALLTWVQRCIARTGIGHVAVSGGVFMNVKANGRILQLPEVEELFVMPTCSDATNSLGAAYAAHARSRARKRSPINVKPLGPLYLGEEMTDEQVRSALQEAMGENGCTENGCRLRVEWPEDPEHAVAQLLARGEIVARAKGRMEFGARALGNRSILADPSRPDCVRIINSMIKSRDFWMPFAPAAPAEDAVRYVEKPQKKTPYHSPYMMLAYPAQPEKAAAFKAAMHPADCTARLQEVPPEWNPDFYRLLREFEKLQGESIVLNTSFNLHGYPIARTAQDALHILQHSALKFLQLGNALVEKID